MTPWPPERTTVRSTNASTLCPIVNIRWFVPGIFLAIGYTLSGSAMCLTIIGFPFGSQAVKSIPLAISSFGYEAVRAENVTTAAT